MPNSSIAEVKPDRTVDARLLVDALKRYNEMILLQPVVHIKTPFWPFMSIVLPGMMSNYAGVSSIFPVKTSSKPSFD